MKKTKEITLNIIPILAMIGLIPLVSNDYWLSVCYFAIIAVSLVTKYTKNDLLFLLFGLVAMAFFEFIFISTGVETFTRHTLFGIMPIWLPILWGYGFVTIKRSIEILDRQ